MVERLVGHVAAAAAAVKAAAGAEAVTAVAAAVAVAAEAAVAAAVAMRAAAARAAAATGGGGWVAAVVPAVCRTVGPEGRKVAVAWEVAAVPWAAAAWVAATAAAAAAAAARAAATRGPMVVTAGGEGCGRIQWREARTSRPRTRHHPRAGPPPHTGCRRASS